MTALCGAFIDAKVRRLDQSRALQATISDAGGERLVQHANERGRRAIAGMIGTARDVVLEDCDVPALVLSTAIVGPRHAVLQPGASAPAIAGSRVHLTELWVGYLEAIARRRGVRRTGSRRIVTRLAVSVSTPAMSSACTAQRTRGESARKRRPDAELGEIEQSPALTFTSAAISARVPDAGGGGAGPEACAAGKTNPKPRIGSAEITSTSIAAAG